MLTNYLKIAFRSLTRNSVYSVINIAGLAVGLSCSILIMLWVNDEINWDRFQTNKASIMQVMLNNAGDNGINTQAAVPLPLVEELKNDRDILFVTPTNWGSTALFTVGEKKIYKKVSSITLLLSKDFTRLIIFSFVLAAPVALWALNHWLNQYDYRVTIQWWVPVFAGVLTLFLSLATVIYQAVKAAMADPVKSLRNE